MLFVRNSGDLSAFSAFSFWWELAELQAAFGEYHRKKNRLRPPSACHELDQPPALIVASPMASSDKKEQTRLRFLDYALYDWWQKYKLSIDLVLEFNALQYIHSRAKDQKVNVYLLPMKFQTSQIKDNIDNVTTADLFVAG